MRRRTACAGLFLALFAAFWSAVVLGFDGVLVKSVYRQTRAESFPTTQGTITRSAVTTSDDAHGVDIAYEYAVGGLSYTGRRYRYGQMSTSDRDDAERVVARHPVGSVATVHYDPDDPAASILEPGIHGMDLFMALFLTPFNVIMLALWVGVGSAAWRRLRKPPAGGVPVLVRRGRTFVRLPAISPSGAAAGTALAVSFVSIFAVGFGLGFDPPVWALGIVWGVVLGAAAGVYVWRRAIVGSGARDLVIDPGEGMLALPRTFGRESDVFVPVESVESVVVERITHVDGEGGASSSWAPAIRWRAEGGEPRTERLVEWWDEDRAESLARWLRTRLGV